MLLFLFLSLIVLSTGASVPMLNFTQIAPSGVTKLRTSGNSALWRMKLPKTKFQYSNGLPYIISLNGTRRQIGYDYAALLHKETSETFNNFLTSTFPKANDRLMLTTFLDYLWSSFLIKHTNKQFLEELEGMADFYKAHPQPSSETPAYTISHRFYTLANMPADPQNIIAMLEQELEQGWPAWLKVAVNDIIKLLEKLVHSCDAYGVWGSRTAGGQLYSSRNLDYQSNTGINKFKLVSFFQIDDPVYGKAHPYATFGFAFGPGALAGMSKKGITVSEMNLDNSKVTFSGLPFPLRLRYVLETATDLDSAMATWNATQNTNSFNFLIASANDAHAGNNGAYALETIMNFTAQFPANSPMESGSTVDCRGSGPGSAWDTNHCWKWTTKHDIVHIGKPLKHAVWRTNHGLNSRVLKTQEPLFNNTVYRYNLMHKLFTELEQAHEPISDAEAIGVVATLGIKGPNYLSCDLPFHGDNVLSIAYVPKDGAGHAYVAFESGSGNSWRPAACSPFIKIDLSKWLQ